MNMLEMRVENARLAELNGGFVRILCALVIAHGREGQLVVTKAQQEAIPPDCMIGSAAFENGDIGFKVITPEMMVDKVEREAGEVQQEQTEGTEGGLRVLPAAEATERAGRRDDIEEEEDLRS